MTTTTCTKKSLGLESAEPAVTPPPPSNAPANFVKKPKLGAAKSKKREIPEGLRDHAPIADGPRPRLELRVLQHLARLDGVRRRHGEQREECGDRRAGEASASHPRSRFSSG